MKLSPAGLPSIVRQIRMRLGETQMVFAKRFGVAYATISRYECGIINLSRTSLLILRSLTLEPPERSVIDRALASPVDFEMPDILADQPTDAEESPAFLRLQAFLYILLRDHLPFGTVEAIIRDHVEKVGDSVQFEDRLHAEYAERLARRIARGR
ncbi:MAG TPA: helix-turn-helix transcriptional regulator [Gemmataceae bacterium]|nr:helix-turn-helix transcriptional regulator [Gemmataceae bacterium]